jgi:hypothetical protein
VAGAAAEEHKDAGFFCANSLAGGGELIAPKDQSGEPHAERSESSGEQSLTTVECERVHSGGLLEKRISRSIAEKAGRSKWVSGGKEERK